MTTILMHLLGSIIVLLLINRLLKFKIPLEILIILSSATLVPDVIDKILTGRRYPIHSVFVIFFLLFVGFIIIRYFLFIKINNKDKKDLILKMFILISITILIHPILDLESAVPLFYPIDSYGYHLIANIIIIQDPTPRISEIKLGFIRDSYDFSIPYGHEASLITTLDLLFIIICIIPITFKCIEYFNSHLEKRESKLSKDFQNK